MAKATQQVRDFVERALRVAAVHDGVLNIGPVSGSMGGSNSTGSELVQRMHRQAIALARAYEKPQSDTILVERLAGEFEATVRSLQVVAVIANEEAVDLLDKLDGLRGIAGRTG